MCWGKRIFTHESGQGLPYYKTHHLCCQVSPLRRRILISKRTQTATVDRAAGQQGHSPRAGGESPPRNRDFLKLWALRPPLSPPRMQLPPPT